MVGEEIALLETGGQRRVAPVAAELLQLRQMDTQVLGGVERTALEAVAAKRGAIEPGTAAAGLDDIRATVPGSFGRGGVQMRGNTGR